MVERSRGRDGDWQRLVDNLRAEPDALVAHFLELFKLQSYDPQLVSDEDVRQTASDTIDMFLLRLAGEPLPVHLAELPARLGARRARQGVPLDAFLGAIRLDFRVLWRALARDARQDALQTLVDNFDHVLNIVEEYAVQVQQAFVLEEAKLNRDSRLHRARLISRLFNAEDGGGTGIASVAEVLGIPLDGTFEVIAVADKYISEVQNRYYSRDDVYSHEEGGTFCLFREQRSVLGWPAEKPAIDGGYVGEIRGLENVPAAARAARNLVRHGAGARGLITVADAWMRVVREKTEESLPGFQDVVLSGLAKATPHERERLVEVVLAYARTGSIKTTAETLFCHRNTVVNRLRAFCEFTGLDVTVPKDAAWALVVLSNEPVASGTR